MNWLGGLISEGLVESLLPNYIFLPGISFVEFHKQGWILSTKISDLPGISSTLLPESILSSRENSQTTFHNELLPMQETFYISFALWSLEEN
jgi:hypothetical protein